MHVVTSHPFETKSTRGHAQKTASHFQISNCPFLFTPSQHETSRAVQGPGQFARLSLANSACTWGHWHKFKGNAPKSPFWFTNFAKWMCTLSIFRAVSLGMWQSGWLHILWFQDPEFNFSLIGAGNVEEHVPFNLLNEHLCVIILTRADYDQSCGYFATSFFEHQPFPNWKDWITCAIGPQDQQRTEGTTVPKRSKNTCTPGTPN